MPVIAEPLFLLTVLVALRVALWGIESVQTRRRVAQVRVSADRAGVRRGPYEPVQTGGASVVPHRRPQVGARRDDIAA